MATGNRGRFAERLKKIALFKRKKIIVDPTEEKKEYNNFYNVLKVAAVIPGLVYDSLTEEINSDNIKKKAEKEKNIIEAKNDDELFNELVSIKENSKFKEEKIDDNKENIFDIKEEIKGTKHKVTGEKKSSQNDFSTELLLTKGDNKNLSIHEDTTEKEIFEDNRIDEIKKLEKKIIDTIKKDLIKMANELEIDESELFILGQIYSDEVILDKCKQNLNRVKSLIYKIDKIKNKYDFLRDNYDFEYILEYNNTSLLDDIIDLKRKVNDVELREVSSEYKLLKIFESQYFVIDKIQNEAIKIEDNIHEKGEELKKRDLDFEELQKKLYNVSDISQKYSSFVSKQQEIMDEVNKNLETISSKEVLDVKIIGFDKLLANSFKYLGFLMISPLRGIFPGIVMQTAVTKNVIDNLRQNLHVEEKKRLEYSAIDCSNVLSNVMNNLSGASDSIDSALEEIVNLKIEYNKKFRKYQDDFSQYSGVISKINDMENKLLGSKLKVEIMKARIKKKEEINAKKLVLVHDMNREQEKK